MPWSFSEESIEWSPEGETIAPDISLEGIVAMAERYEAAKLVIGRKYDITKLEYNGWTGEKDDLVADGYDWRNYFDDGVYSGPDMYGIEPLFSVDSIDLAIES